MYTCLDSCYVCGYVPARGLHVIYDVTIDLVQVLSRLPAQTSFSKHLFTWKGEYNAAKAWGYGPSIGFSSWLLNIELYSTWTESFAGIIEGFHGHIPPAWKYLVLFRGTDLVLFLGTYLDLFRGTNVRFVPRNRSVPRNISASPTFNDLVPHLIIIC